MAEDQLQQTPDEILIETLRTNVEKACNGDLQTRLAAVAVLVEELKKSTSSMTSVPKPMKHLLPYLEELTRAYNTYTNEEFRKKIADLLSLLSIINVDTKYDVLLYRLECPVENIGFWGHEYVRCLTLNLIKASKNLQDLPSGIDINPLVDQISKYYMTHNDEPDACDLLLELNRLEDIVPLVDEESHNRVCTYLLQLYDYKPEPINTNILRVLVTIYKKLNKVNQALIMALKLNDRELAVDIFRNCEDKLVQKQFAFLLARQLIVFDDLMDDELLNIAQNFDLHNLYNKVAEHLGRNKPKTPDDILQFQASIGNRNAQREDKANLGMAKCFVSAFYNAAIKKDLYFTTDTDNKIIRERNVGVGRAVAVASIAMLHLWDIMTGTNNLLYYQSDEDSSDPYVTMGALAGIGLITAAVRSDYDTARALLTPRLENKNQNENVLVGAILGLAFAYGGKADDDLLELLKPHISLDNFRVCAMACLAVGMIYVGHPSDPALVAISQILYDLNETTANAQNAPYLPFLALAIGLIFMGQQGDAIQAALEILSTINSQYAEFFKVVLESLAYAGTGNVLQIQNMLRVCTGDNSISHAAAVIGIAIIALGDPIGTQMSKRMFELILQYGKPNARKMVPIAIALTSISQPLPELVDQLHRIGHDPDVNVARAACVALGLIGAGTNNTRVINTLFALELYHKNDTSVLTLLRNSVGLTHLGQGLMTLSPTYGDGLLIHQVALASLLAVAYSCMNSEELLIKKDPLLLFFIVPAIGPRFLVTLDENLEILPLQVRVGQAVDVVGQAGKPRKITGFQTLDTPVVLEAERELSLLMIHTNFVASWKVLLFVRKRENKANEEKQQ
ncbi:Proteasome/cyclosome repeat family protein [Trichomonas vaginalis G3]|uniref:Proteasome/cyclosome repeat family protein n=1 Tax=Trichomonas vaginalis (strain ATCC PRA-98 / G3) TaxID=412133 RepID=A2EPF2_TRIV3|nr:Proteasome/cyclosome repeat family protein [Trichomonas vaginalis G3]|eukprot:XP_001317683.1 Proteasome/cyclosome repeat family protein [Trichomonas vaginalis G3]